MGGEVLALVRFLKMEELMLGSEGIIAQLIRGLEVPVDPIKPIIEAVLLSGLQGPRGIEGAAVQQGRELHLRLAVAVAREAHPKIKIDVERALLHVDPVQADDIDPGIDHALNPVMPVAEGGDMALLPFRGEIDPIGQVDADPLSRGGDEPPMMEIAKANWARNVAIGIKVQPAR